MKMRNSYNIGDTADHKDVSSDEHINQTKIHTTVCVMLLSVQVECLLTTDKGTEKYFCPLPDPVGNTDGRPVPPET